MSTESDPYRALVIRDWLDYTITSDELSLYLKHYNKSVPVKNKD